MNVSPTAFIRAESATLDDSNTVSARPGTPLSSGLVQHLKTELRPDPARVVLRPFMPADTPIPGHAASEHRDHVVARILALTPTEAESALCAILSRIEPRHRQAMAVFERRYIDVADLTPGICAATTWHARLIGACFTAEYAFEAAALFNPSMVPHPDQNGVPTGGLRFILSLRAIGEGHVSSITFRTGMISPTGDVQVDPPGTDPISARAEKIPGGTPETPGVRLSCGNDPPANVVLFPTQYAHRHGLEDLRLVPFEDEHGARSYLGTLTGVGGETIRQELLRTRDFSSFDIVPLSGPHAATKGMALFPRRVNGRYAMLGRQDHESLRFMASSDLYRWDDGVPLLLPTAPWEAVQLGNCGSPIELDEGWLVLTHGVGPLRSYAIGACLLDRDDPTRVTRRLALPLLAANARQWSGYVPNTVYSCGGLVHDRWLYLPYGVADSFATIARVPVGALLDAMVPCA